MKNILKNTILQNTQNRHKLINNGDQINVPYNYCFSLLLQTLDLKVNVLSFIDFLIQFLELVA